MMYDDQIEFTSVDLRNWMNEFGFDIDSMMKLLGVSKTCIQYWLLNKRKMPQTTIKLLLYFRRYPQRIFDF